MRLAGHDRTGFAHQEIEVGPLVGLQYGVDIEFVPAACVGRRPARGRPGVAATDQLDLIDQEVEGRVVAQVKTGRPLLVKQGANLRNKPLCFGEPERATTPSHG